MRIVDALIAAAAAAIVNAEVHVVDVGEEGLTFEPQTLNPKKGDTVVFHLYPRHNVVSSNFNQPCQHNDNSWFSGPFEKTDNGKKKYVVNVTSEDPVWYYCAVQEHCQYGMVGAWNAPSTGNTIQVYAAAAKNVQQASAPSSIKGGALLEDEQVSSLTGSTPSSTQSESSSSAQSTSETTPETTSSGSAAASPTESGASTSPTSAAEVLHPGFVTSTLATVFGIAAWSL